MTSKEPINLSRQGAKLYVRGQGTPRGQMANSIVFDEVSETPEPVDALPLFRCDFHPRMQFDSQGKPFIWMG